MADTAGVLTYKPPFDPFENVEENRYEHIRPGKKRDGGFDWSFIEGSYTINKEIVYGVHMRRIQPGSDTIEGSTFYVLGTLPEGPHNLSGLKSTVLPVTPSKRSGIEEVIAGALQRIEKPAHGAEVIFRD